MSRSLLLAAVAALLTAPARAADPAEAAAAANAARPAVQAALAAGDLTKLVRVDSFAAVDNQVRARGVFLNPADGDDARKKVRDELAKELAAAVRKAVPAAEGVAVVPGFDEPQYADQPQARIQQAAFAAGGQYDQLLVNGGYDKGGRFVLTGLAGPGTAGWLAEQVRAALADPNPAPVLTPPGGRKELAADGVKAIDWKATPAAAQARLASAAAGKDSGRLRVDRVYPAYDRAARKWVVRFAGVRVGEEELDGGGNVVVRALQDLAAGLPDAGVSVEGLGSAARVVFDPAGRVNLLQAAVAKDGALDGTRIDPGVGFDAKGKAKLVGVRPRFAGPSAAADAWEGRLKAALEAALKGAEQGGKSPYQGLLDGGLTTDGMIPAPVPRLLAEMRGWAAGSEAVEDVRISRLYYDPSGTLKLVGKYVADEDKKKIITEFERRAQGELPPRPSGPARPPAGEKIYHLTDGTTPVSAVVQPPDPPAAGDSYDQLQKFEGGFSAALRQRLTADPKAWYGVVIERGYFDTDDRYTVRGVADRADQKAALDRLIAEYKTGDRWAEYFRTPPAPAALAVLPMKDLLDRANRVIPGYPALDGYTLRDIGYDDKFNLTFKVGLVGFANDRATAAAEGQLRGLIATSRTWARRLPKDRDGVPSRVVFGRPDPAVPVNDGLAAEAAPEAARLLLRHLGPAPTAPTAGGCVTVAGPAGTAVVVCDPPRPAPVAEARRLLDQGRLHDPSDSAGWYLSGTLHYLAGDTELARRDFYRVAGVEGPFGRGNAAAWGRRHELAAGIQGELRHCLDGLLKDCQREVAAGRGAITLDGRE